MLKLKEVVDKQRDELRARVQEITTISKEVEAVRRHKHMTIRLPKHADTFSLKVTHSCTAALDSRGNIFSSFNWVLGF